MQGAYPGDPSRNPMLEALANAEAAKAQGDPSQQFAPNMGAPGVPGQANMGAYLNAQKPPTNAPRQSDSYDQNGKPPMSTEQELDLARRGMGADKVDPQDPVKDGNFPSQEEIDLILRQPTDANLEAFDAKYGDGAAGEILGGDEEAKPKRTNSDDGDHEYR